MKIIVCGAGQVGLQIAKHLSDERMDVIVIDKSSDLITHPQVQASLQFLRR